MLLFLIFTIFSGSLLGVVWWFTGVFIKFSFKFVVHGFNLSSVVRLFSYYMERPEVAEYIIDCCIGGVVFMQLLTPFAVQIAWIGANPFLVFTRSFIREGKI